jgi:1,2-diacylglycerol 3-beta-glucosyltransferase
MAELFIHSVLWVALSINALASGYLLILALMSLLPWQRRTSVTTSVSRLAIVVPAHNEEILLPKLLESLRAQEYPPDRFTVHLVADNCTDNTAAVARSFGVKVYTRSDIEAPGKGQALRWFFDQIESETQVDAFIFIDADSVVDANFLSAMNARLVAGAQALQASYRVLDPASHALVGLRALAFAMMHDLRGRGKNRLGLSCGLWGNGMLLSSKVISLIPWGGFSAVEDAEQHLQLLLKGAKVEFVQETHVYGYMPSTFRAAKDQQRRWEGGRQSLFKSYGKGLLLAVARTRSKVLAAALVDLAIPPASVHLVVSLTLLPCGLWIGEAAGLTAAASFAALCGYIIVGLIAAGLPAKAYLSLIYAPPYVCWKAWLFACQLPKRAGPAWLPTSRDS